MNRSSALIFALGLVAGQSLAHAQQAQQPQQPRVFLQATSHGNVWAARRDQSMEMAKDFQKNCPDVKVTILPNVADYTVILNHIEVGAFGRDNQFQVANRQGDMLGGVREKGGIKSGSINGGVKAACDVILADWRMVQSAPQNVAAPQPAPANAAPAPTPAPVAAPVSAPTPTSVQYKPQENPELQTATQTSWEPMAPQDSLADAARKQKQHKACLELAKANPSIVCK